MSLVKPWFSWAWSFEPNKRQVPWQICSLCPVGWHPKTDPAEGKPVDASTADSCQWRYLVSVRECSNWAMCGPQIWLVNFLKQMWKMTVLVIDTFDCQTATMFDLLHKSWVVLLRQICSIIVLEWEKVALPTRINRVCLKLFCIQPEPLRRRPQLGRFIYCLPVWRRYSTCVLQTTTDGSLARNEVFCLSSPRPANNDCVIICLNVLPSLSHSRNGNLEW